jgi:metallo-beta-lactamase class B
MGFQGIVTIMFIRNSVQMTLLAVFFAVAIPFTFGQDRYSVVQENSAKREPFQLFDNLFFVGTKASAAWILQTDQGLILIDSAPSGETGALVDNIKKLKLNPIDIRYLIVTHGDYNQVGGAKRMQEEFGAVVLMTGEAWEASTSLAEQGSGYVPPLKHLTATESGSVTLGRDRVSFFKTPGHTPGALSVGFTVYDGGYPYEAMIFGGVGVDVANEVALATYIQSIRKLQSLESIDVNIPNGENLSDFFGMVKKFKAVSEDGVHPFVDPGGWSRWLEGLLEEAGG